MKNLTLLLIFTFSAYQSISQDKSELFRQLNSEVDTTKIDALNELCWFYKYSNSDSAIYFGQRALDESNKIEYDFGIAKAYNNIAIVYWGAGAYDTAVAYLDSARVVYDRMGLIKGICSCLINSGLLKQSMAKIPEALQDLFLALEIQEEHQFDGYLAPILNNIGNCYFVNEDYSNAKKWYERSLIEKKRTNSPTISNTQMNLGVSLQNLGDLDSALYYYELALEGIEKSQSWLKLQEILLNIGTVYLELEQSITAEEYLLKSLGLDSLTDNAQGRNFAQIRLSELYQQTRDYPRAIKHGNLALQAAIEIQNNSRIEASYLMLYEAYKKSGDTSAALSSLEKRIQFRDSVFHTDKEEIIADMETKYETEKKEQQLKVLNAERELQQAQIEQFRILVIAISIIAVLTMAAIILFNSRKRYQLKASLAEEREQLQKTRFKAVIDAEEKERKRIARELHDGLGQLLSTARITVSALDNDENPKVKNSMKVIDMAVKEVRSISHNMMPNALVKVGLKEALQDMMRKVDESGNINGVFDCKTELRLDESQSISLYRIAQELVNNALKYSEANEIRMTLSDNDHQLEMVLEDDGKGFNTSKIQDSTGIGWSNIQARVDLLGGELQIDSVEGQGTKVSISLQYSDLKAAG